MNEQLLSLFLGAILSLLAGTPLAGWYETLQPKQKQLYMLLASAVIASAIELYTCYASNVCATVELEYLISVAEQALLAFLASQGTHNVVKLYLRDFMK